MDALKTQVVDELKARFSRMTSAVFVNYEGMSVSDIESLRSQFRAKGVDYKVAKNTLIRRALSDEAWVTELGDALKGMTGVAWSYEEPSTAARILKSFIKDNEKLKIKAGVMDGQVLDSKAVENQLATLPSKDEARASLLATLMAPAQQLVMLFNTPAGNFVRLLEAKKSQD
ncbi:MAG: 50S ribosomal protein L10 [Polyangiaceae bacterium]|nr:50S ribosomal protein L10 [Polyangiaceae bacterium]